ncbi:type II toxin-antitoxin system RelE family toxin [Kitasatospora acidiphila]|uniref:type II toxin-antitoxin system RelE family toxin n=1 Tax=Kitasatospora acidiphila TaxID=2567942 RepID=UPI0022658E84|nr:type II toxin-antitoxin system RelE/ParE family toxin [Kitasatospora acidiphila]
MADLAWLSASCRRPCDSPHPPGTAAYGSADLRRMHVGRYRVLYEVTEATVTIVVIHLGRIG